MNSHAPQGPLNILVVDDSATTRAMIHRIIKMAGIPVKSVREAPDGSSAIALLERTTAEDAVHLILTDLNMPEMNGAQLTQHLRSTPDFKSIPVIVVTAQPDDLYLSPILRQQVQGWLCKPFTPEAMRNAIEQALLVPAA